MKQILADIVGSDHVLGADALSLRDPGYCDHSLNAGLLVRPANASELSGICKAAHSQGFTLVPHGGLTGLVEGTASSAGQVIVSFERMSDILCIDTTQGIAEVGAGVTLDTLQQALAPLGLMTGVDIPSRGSCTIGGMVGTNAGGIRVLKYGMMRQNVLGLEVVLADGRILDLTNPLIKNNAGYDLKQIFIGSEGTLGLVTKVVLRLWPMPGGAACALLACHTAETLPGLFERARDSLGSDLLSFEAMWPEYYALTTSQPGFARPPMARDFGVYAIVEVSGRTQAEADATLLEFVEPSFENGQIVDAVLAQSEADRTAIWRSREDSDAIDTVSDRSLSYDVGVQLADLTGFVDRLREACRALPHPLTPYIFGHMGDGNLHVMFAVTEAQYTRRAVYDDLIYDTLSAFPATTISAEHGIGLEKRPYLNRSVSTEARATMADLKRAFDPSGILNPGKILEP